MSDLPKKKRRMEEGDAVAGMAKFVAGLPARRDPVAETREQLAYLMRAELVCCDIYNRINAPYDDLGDNPTKEEWTRASRLSTMRRKTARELGSYHDICYFGEWAARLCLTGDLPNFPLIYTERLNDEEWVEELVQPGPVRIKTIHRNVERPKRRKVTPDA